MSTTVSQARWLHPSRWTLRVRLVASMVALLAVVSLAIGAVSIVALDRYMTNQVAIQLGQAATRGNGGAQSGHGRPGGPGGSDDQNPVDGPNQAPGTLGMTIRNGQVLTAKLAAADGSTGAPSAAAQQVLLHLPADGRQRTVDLGEGLGRYLVVGEQTLEGTTLTGLPLSGVEAAIARLALVVSLVTLIGLVAAITAGTAIVRFTLRPLDRLAATAARVSELPLDRGDVSPDVRVLDTDTDPGTEVGQVGAALDRMLGHVFRALQVRNASEARMRRFVADASHELRTPLASIRGYAELTLRRGDDLSPPVEHALARVESEAVRMTGLVEDLLLLARLDEGAQAASLRQDLVDLTEVAIDGVSDAHVLGGEHRWLLELPDEPVTVLGDASRLRQVLTNLLANARVHTPAGTEVTVRLTAAAQEVVLEVTDNGPGIPPSLLPEVFDRFTRADSSRSRAAGSTGLGLSIVASVVEAHGGRVEVTSRPGSTSFRVHLPAGAPVELPAGSLAELPAAAAAG